MVSQYYKQSALWEFGPLSDSHNVSMKGQAFLQV